MLGDINKDGVIEILDLSLVLNVYGINSSAANYEEKYDINADGDVEILDVSLILSNYMKTRTRKGGTV